MLAGHKHWVKKTYQKSGSLYDSALSNPVNEGCFGVLLGKKSSAALQNSKHYLYITSH